MVVKICLHLEPYNNRDINTIVEDLKYIHNQGYTSHPAYYHISTNSNLLPVVYVYDSYRIKSSEWEKILQSNDQQKTIRNKIYNAYLIGLLLDMDDCRTLYESGFNGGYTYFIGNGVSTASSPDNWNYLLEQCTKYNVTFYPSIGPGYDDLSVRPWNKPATNSRDHGLTYVKLFNKAYNRKPPLSTSSSPLTTSPAIGGLGIVSFNEWHEGTQIEPAIPYRWNYFMKSKIYQDYLPYSPEFYLRLTRLLINQYEGNVDDDSLPRKFMETSKHEMEQLNTLMKIS
ncbi:unnamed protein product [Schistosoma turkestanicum]|nr:unnamed protein product [Schistosoma turkestanicum]